MCIFFIENLGVQISWNCFCLNILITKKKKLHKLYVKFLLTNDFYLCLFLRFLTKSV